MKHHSLRTDICFHNTFSTFTFHSNAPSPNPVIFLLYLSSYECFYNFSVLPSCCVVCYFFQTVTVSRSASQNSSVSFSSQNKGKSLPSTPILNPTISKSIFQTTLSPCFHFWHSMLNVTPSAHNFHSTTKENYVNLSLNLGQFRFSNLNIAFVFYVTPHKSENNCTYSVIKFWLRFHLPSVRIFIILLFTVMNRV